MKYGISLSLKLNASKSSRWSTARSESQHLHCGENRKLIALGFQRLSAFFLPVNKGYRKKDVDSLSMK
jgi:hypothetical protein